MTELEITKVIANISSNCFKKKRICLYHNCTHEAINSHLLQRNGILNHISENNHIYQLRANYGLRIGAKKQIGFELISDKKGMAFLGFCENHDNALFKHIEKDNSDFSDYKSKLLFTYRAFSNELRKKEIIIDLFDRCINSNTLKGQINEIYLKNSSDDFKKGFNHLKKYVEYCYNDLTNNECNFIFVEYVFDKFEFCASSVFSPAEVSELIGENLINMIAIHVIPLENSLKVILGYHKNHVDDWVINYITSYKNIDRFLLLEKLSDLITNRIETWAISVSLYKTITQEKLELHDYYFKSNIENHSRDLKSTFNLFENS